MVAGIDSAVDVAATGMHTAVLDSGGTLSGRHDVLRDFNLVQKKCKRVLILGGAFLCQKPASSRGSLVT